MKENMVSTIAIVIAFALMCNALAANSALARLRVLAGSGGMIDLYTDRGGQGPDQFGGIFQPQELVVLYALVTYNDWPIANSLVSFEINGPTNPYENITIIRVASTNESGITETDFRIPLPLENPVAIVYGRWNATATVVVGQETLSDTLTFFVIILGDVDHDGKVDIKDLVLMAIAYGSQPNDPNWNPDADMDYNQRVGLSDLSMLATHYGQHYP